LAIVVILEAFSFTNFVISCLIFNVYNVDPSLSLATFVVPKAFSFVDPCVSNVLSFTISIVDPTFSLAIPTIFKAFCFVSSTIEATLFFVSPTFS
jgi:hypothetical protein